MIEKERVGIEKKVGSKEVEIGDWRKEGKKIIEDKWNGGIEKRKGKGKKDDEGGIVGLINVEELMEMEKKKMDWIKMRIKKKRERKIDEKKLIKINRVEKREKKIEILIGEGERCIGKEGWKLMRRKEEVGRIKGRGEMIEFLKNGRFEFKKLGRMEF